MPRRLLLATLFLAIGLGRAQAEDPGERVVEPTTATPTRVEILPTKNVEAIKQWSLSPGATRRRTDGKELSEATSKALLAVLTDGVRSCACGARRLKWAWALPAASGEVHPKVLVAFVDPLLSSGRTRDYARLALFRYTDGGYVVTSAMAFKRPAAEAGSFELRVHSRHDADGDGKEDLELLVVEKSEHGTRCAVAAFQTASAEAKLGDVPCPEGAGATEDKARNLF